jgi:hypothetical protein
MKEEKVEVRYLPKRPDGSLSEGEEYRSAGGEGASGSLLVVAGDTFKCSKEKLEQLRRDFGGTFEEVVHTKTPQKTERKTTRKATKARVKGVHTK